MLLLIPGCMGGGGGIPGGFMGPPAELASGGGRMGGGAGMLPILKLLLGRKLLDFPEADVSEEGSISRLLAGSPWPY